MRRAGSSRSPAKAVDRDLVKNDSFKPGHLPVVVGAAAVLEALQHLALPRGDGQQLTRASQLHNLTIEIVAPGHMSQFGALQVGLARDQIGCGHRSRGRVQLSRAGAGDPVGRSLQLLLAAVMIVHRAGYNFLGGVLVALAQRANALKSKSERGVRHTRMFDSRAGTCSAPGRLF